MDARVELFDSPGEMPAADPLAPRPAQVPLPGRRPAFRFVAVLSGVGLAGYGLHRLRRRPRHLDPIR